MFLQPCDSAFAGAATGHDETAIRDARSRPLVSQRLGIQYNQRGHFTGFVAFATLMARVRREVSEE
jgi:hypothetical protein